MLAIIAAIENDSEREFMTRIYLQYYKKMLNKALYKLSKYETRNVAEYLRDSEYIVFSQAYQSTTQIDSENAEINEIIQIGDSDGLLVVKNGMTDILWSMGDTVFHLYGMGETNEMVKMAESIKLIK